MGIASLILGILSLLFALIPGCGLLLAPVPALIGLGLGIAEWVGKNKKGEPKGLGIAGTIISLIAFVVLLGWVGLFAAQKPEDKTWQEWFEESGSGMESSFETEFESQMEDLEKELEEAETELKAVEEAVEASSSEAPAPEPAN